MMMKKYNTRSYDKIIFILLAMFLLFVRIYYYENDRIQYVILSTGEKYKYVSLIKSLLNNQGVNNKDIHVFVDSEYEMDIDVNQYIIPSTMGNTKNDRLTHNYRYIFDNIFYKFQYAVILEDDIFPASDAVKYFEWGVKVMQMDESVFAISGSNDNSVDHLHGRYNDVFSRAEQFIGLGWLTSANVYKKFLSTHISSCPSSLAWDQCTNKALMDNKMVTVFPMVQRTLHVPYEKGTHKELAGLSFNTKASVVYPEPYFLSAQYYRKYIEKYVIPRSYSIVMDGTYSGNKREWEKEIRRSTNVPWPISHLARKPFGYNDDVIVYPGEHKPIVVFNQNKISVDKKSLRKWLA